MDFGRVLAEATQRRALTADERAGRIGPCGHDGCFLPPGHDARPTRPNRAADGHLQQPQLRLLQPERFQPQSE
jgi:hypothetical protein